MMKKLKEQIVEGCDDDYEGLWIIIRQVQSVFPSISYEEIREITIKIIRDLLKEELIVAGIPNDTGGFLEWNFTVEQTIERIEKEWGELGSIPDKGDIVWFTTPADN